MAQKVGYGENNFPYLEGPFVICILEKGRIEVELKGHCTSVLPDLSIYKLLERTYGSTHYRSASLESQVDWLNEQVKLGRIFLDPIHKRMWIA